MNFISLADVLRRDAVVDFNIGEKDTEEEKETKLAAFTDEHSRIAAELHARLHNTIKRPQWFEIDAETGMPLRSDAVADEGMAMLKHIAGQAKRDIAERNQHIAACIACGLDLRTVPQSRSMADIRKFPFLRETKIGFDLDELCIFLAPFKADLQRNAESIKGVMAQRCKRILDIIKENGYDPMQLPPNPAGKRGVKADIRAIFKKRYPNDYTVSKFDTAWEQLSAGDIAISKELSP